MKPRESLESVGLVLVDAFGRVRAIDDIGCAVLGIGSEEAPGTHVIELVDSPQRARLLEPEGIVSSLVSNS